MDETEHRMMIDALNNICATLAGIASKLEAVEATIAMLEFDGDGRLLTNDTGL